MRKELFLYRPVNDKTWFFMRGSSLISSLSCSFSENIGVSNMIQVSQHLAAILSDQKKFIVFDAVKR